MSPIWMASPPEVHSALLSSGPGPGALLAAAGAWSALGAEYAATADELTAVLAAVQAGGWQGPSAEQYVAAHGSYLSWLLDSTAKSTAAATLHQTAAAAYTGALAAMPTLPELAANHVTHRVLIATNFFGINTIPIAVAEADYVRMWVQAATTMTTYHAVSESALAAVPATAPAPHIVAPGGEASTAADTGPSWQDQLAQWITDYNMGFADPLAQLFYPNGWPINPMTVVNALTPLFSQIPGIQPALASALAWNVFHNLMLVFPLIQASPLLFAAAIPAVIAATGAVGLAGLAGVAGVAGVVAAPVVDLPAAGATATPVGGSTLASSAPGGIETTMSTTSTTSGPAGPSPATMTGGGPAGGGPGVGFGPTAANPLGAHAAMTDVSYAVSASGLPAQSSASRRRSRQAQESGSDDATAPAERTPAREQVRGRRRKMGLRGHGDEFMDMNVEVDPDWGEPASAGASDRGAGALGFAGAAAKPGVTRAAGLTTLAGGALSGGPAVPMVPSSWSD